MTVDVIGHDAAQILTATTELEPAVIFHTLRLQMGFDPFAAAPGLFDAWVLPECQPLPPATIKQMITQITGCEYEEWAASDVARMLDFLNR